MYSFPAAKYPENLINIYPEKIEKKRKQLFHIAKEYGIYASETLRCSQELDLMIIEIQEKNLGLG